MSASRRTALDMLALAASSAVGAETFSEPPDIPGRIQTCSGAYNRERVACAFEQLAKELRRESVEVIDLKISASISANEIADTHQLVLNFLYRPEI